MGTSGILNLNKPKGATSFAMVSLVRRLTGERRVGHAGTLDPLASGVLPVLIGQGTRMMEFLSSQPKAYRASICLGVSTDTGDSEGAVVSRADCPEVSTQALETVLACFTGSIQQVPPMYSALKHKGEPLYRLARRGVSIPRAARTAHIYSLTLLAWEPPTATLELECSKGTYVRSLAVDLGDRLGCGGHLTALVRLRSGPLTLEDAVTLDELETAARLDCWRDLLRPIDEPVLDCNAVIVGDATERAVRTGRPLDSRTIAPGRPGDWCRAYSLRGQFFSLLRFQPETEVWHPDRVFTPEEP